MSLASALKTGDLTELPSRRDEDWRWTDLRGLIRTLPPVSPKFEGDLGAGPFTADETLTIINGQGVVDLTIAAGESRVIALRLIAATAARNAVVERVVLASDTAEAVSVVDAEVALAAGAKFAQTILTTGARRQRIETRVAHPGAHADLRLDGIYLLDKQRHADLTTQVTHGGVDGTTSQLTKGMVADQARGVFQGRIIVQPGADQTDARMGHHALIMSDKAEIDAKPELLIFADDVSCAHGNTIGALDEQAIFYARQRGIPELEARAMLTEAFVGEVVERIEHEPAREVARAWVAQRLGRSAL
jgi:Fe-S cluster assembly protein SufD